MSEKSRATPACFAGLYARFQSPISTLDCGQKCAPYNEHGAPFCCDTQHAVPTAYAAEWVYLQENTDLWHPWQAQTPQETELLQAETPDGLHLIECQGHTRCQRDFRSMTCRAFPFFPYFTSDGDFIGLSYYWEYEDRCWVISNLSQVSLTYREEFIQVYEELFRYLPEERDNFANHSAHMRRVFEGKQRTIPVLHRDGGCYKVSPRSEKMKKVSVETLPVFGPYRIAAQLPFPDEMVER